MPHLVLGQQGQLLHSQLPVNERHPVGVDSEPAVRVGDVIGHDQVQSLAPHFGFGVRHQVLAFGGKPHSYEIALSCLQNIGSLGQGNRQVSGGLLDLLRRCRRRAVVSHRRGHDEGVGPLHVPQHRVAHLLGRLYPDQPHLGRVRKAGGSGDQHHFRPPVSGCFGQRVPHLPR